MTRGILVSSGRGGSQELTNQELARLALVSKKHYNLVREELAERKLVSKTKKSAEEHKLVVFK